MSSLRQQLGQWFKENEPYQASNLTQKQLEAGHAKALKDLKANKTALDLPYFRGIWKAYLRGAFKPKTHVSKLNKPEVKVADIKILPWKPGSETYNKKMFETWETKKGIDTILSNSGGATKATSFIVTGEPGAGKTTICADTQKVLQDRYPKAKIACIQSEMKKFDISYEFHENKMPWMSDLNYILLNEYGYENIKNVLIKIFTSGYDVLFVDSIENIVGKLCVYADMKGKEAEKFLLELFENANDGKNNKNEKGEDVYTTVFAIQQMTKGGEFKGDNALKHETTGMLEVRNDGRGGRYIEFSKNRRCGKHSDKKLFFSLDKENGNTVQYDLKLFNEMELQMDIARMEKEKMAELSENFLQIMKKPDALQKKDEEKNAEMVATISNVAAMVMDDVELQTAE